MAIAVGAQFSLVIVVPMALGFLLYVAPVRRGAATIIWAAACIVGLVLFTAIYFFHVHSLRESVAHAAFWRFSLNGFTIARVYGEVAKQIVRAFVVFSVILPVPVATYFLWPRARYFGNTAPLLVGILFIIFSIGHPHTAGAGFLLSSIPFLFIFTSGVVADLLETSYRPVFLAAAWALLITNAAMTLIFLARVPRG